MKNFIYVLLVAISTTFVTSINFECDYHYFALGPAIGVRYSCRGMPFGDSSDPYVRNITGVHLPGLNNADVIGFYTYHDPVLFVPRGLVVHFPNMLTLAVLNGTLVRLHSDDLAGYNHLLALSLRDNHIEEIPIGFYEQVPNLLNTNMLQNRIARVAPNMFASLVNLTVANFLGNSCVNMEADITTLPLLQHILNTNCTL